MKRFHTTRFDCAVLLGIVFSVMLANLSVFGRECAQVRGDVVRLHILANSDSGYDQGLKLRVRDRILAQVGGIFSAQQSQADAKAAAVASLPEIEAAARAALIELAVKRRCAPRFAACISQRGSTTICPCRQAFMTPCA